MPTAPEVGEHVGDFALPGGVFTGASFERRDFTLCQQRGFPLVLVFHQGDDTAACTERLCSYSNSLEMFPEHGPRVWGISPRSVDSHEAFARKHDLRIPLLSDAGRDVARSFGMSASGVEHRQAVFLIAPDGTLHWKRVSLLGAPLPSLTTLSRHLAAIQGG
ncbi:redoxin domain-containing protein [Streptomyces sp. ISL-99]|uniref:peroxiredoxin family protein n=1 Tax=Streptomyces sp. ISL-99 TaxID=2819193 RepID=UPI001BE881AE|nr:redoxin domain-containing protein [Streptomyces sp. ISL-99]MBT2526825.1 redoxin domain-containing protein [Streptomyces sp. ISL-99]